MSRGVSRVAVTVLFAVSITLGAAGVARAVSGGGYQPSQQDCPANADASNAPKGATTPGCHDFKVNAQDRTGKRFAEVGLDQLPNGYPSTPGLLGVGYPGSPNFPHAGCAAVNTNGTLGGPGTGCGTNKAGTGATAVVDTQNTSRNAVTLETGAPDLTGLVGSILSGLQGYVGADDNLDAGEHDGVTGLNGTDQSVNGPSDGGAFFAYLWPNAVTTTPSLSNPVPVAGGGEGACADGFCQEATTQQQTLFQGNPNTTTSRQAANYQGKQWDPYNCSSGDQNSEKACQTPPGGSMNGWRQGEAHTVNAEPGVQVYEDPDPQGSPIDPIYEAGLTPQPNLYPIPGVYAGTCGVVAGGGPVAKLPAGTPATNSAGQAVVPTGC